MDTTRIAVPTLDGPRRSSAALYARAAQPDHLQRQIAELYLAAAAHGFVDCALYTDLASGTERKRTGLERLRDALRAGRYRNVLLTDPTRIGRKLADVQQVQDEWVHAGVAVIFTGMPRL
jgi:DNA invertase Pin-like site-specific DNA recombinase